MDWKGAVVHLDLKKLHHAVVLADERNFARTASKVHLSQPALTRSIQALEAALDARLFDRDLTHVTPTPVGLAFVERARELLKQAATLQREVELLRSADLGDVALGVGPIPATVLLPQVLAQLAREHPRVHASVEINNWQVLSEHLLNERIEFFIADVRDLPESDSLQITRIGAPQTGGFFVRSGHLLADLPRVSPKTLAGYPMASVSLPLLAQRKLRAYLGENADYPHLPTISCDKLEIVTSIALNSDAIAINIHAAVQAEVKAGRLKQIQLQKPPALATEFSLVSLAGRSFSPSARWMIERMKQLSA